MMWEFNKERVAVAERMMQNEMASAQLYHDTAPLIPADPYFGLAGVELERVVIPALCGSMGRIIPEPEEQRG